MGNWYGISRLAIEFRDEDNTLADKRMLYNLGSTTYVKIMLLERAINLMDVSLQLMSLAI